MAKKDKPIKGKFKQSSHRSKLRKEREDRLRSKQKQSQKKRINEELTNMVKAENIDELDFKSKKKIVIQLQNLIISFPNENYDKIEMLLTFLQDKNVKIIMKTMKLLKNLFVDILPSYIIRTDDADKSQKSKMLSKEIDTLHNYEKALLRYYEKFINILDVFTKTFSNAKKSNKESIMKMNEYTVKTLAELFQKFHYFNNAENLYRILIEKLSDSNENVRLLSFNSIYSVLSIQDNSSQSLDLKLAIIKLISHIIFIKPHEKFSPNVLDLFTAHKIEFPDLTQKEEKFNLNDIKFGVKSNDELMSKHESKKAKKQLKSLMQEKEKIVKNLKKEMSEYETVHSPKMIYNMNLKILKKILLLFFDILKYKRDSPLIRSVLSGIGVLCENINVEILIDLQKSIYGYVNYILLKQSDENKKVFAITALKASLTITEKLTKVILSIEDSNLINSTYLFISKIVEKENMNKMSKDDFFCVMELIETILLKNRQFSIDTVAAFVKRLALFTNKLNLNFVPAFLSVIKRILQKYPMLNSMLEQDDDYFEYGIVTDPSISNAKQSNICNEITEISNKYGKDTKDAKSKLIKQLCEYILKNGKTNANLDSLSFFDLLIS
jgi:nucleolar complex protein 3